MVNLQWLDSSLTKKRPEKNGLDSGNCTWMFWTHPLLCKLQNKKNAIIHQAWIVYPHFGMQQINKQLQWGQWGKQTHEILHVLENLDYQFQSIDMQVSTLNPLKKYSFFKPLGFSHANSVSLKKEKTPKSWTSNYPMIWKILGLFSSPISREIDHP